MISSVLKMNNPIRNLFWSKKFLKKNLTPIVWNSLSMNLKLLNSLNDFKLKLKDHHFKKLRNMEQDIFAY